MTALLVLLSVLLVISLAGLWVLLRRRRPVVEDVAEKAAKQTVQETLRRLDGHP